MIMRLPGIYEERLSRSRDGEYRESGESGA